MDDVDLLARFAPRTEPHFHCEGLEHASGIYTITNVKNGRVYVGQAQEFWPRWLEHARLLRQEKHGNPFLQADYLKSGPGYFHFDIVEEADVAFLDSVEASWIDRYFDDQQKCYNISRDARAPMRGRTHSTEAKLKIGQASSTANRSMDWRQNISKSLTGKKQSESHRVSNSESHKGLKQRPETVEKRRLQLIGRKMSPEFGQAASLRQQGEKAANAKLCETQIQEMHVLRIIGATQKEIASRLGVSRQQVGAILQGNRWKHLGLGQEYARSDTKLTPSHVAEIHRLKAEGALQQKEIAQLFGVSPAIISQILHGIRRPELHPSRLK